MTTLSDIGEGEAIKCLTALLPDDATVTTGPGDDCAVVRPPESSDTELLLTSDPLIQDIHFTIETPANAIGHKAIGRVLSDIAAMGGTPAWALINIVAPPSTDIDFLSSITQSAAALAKKHCLSIVGGDLARGEQLELHVFAVGTVPTGMAILRSGAYPDDLIYVTGRLGGSRSGKHHSFEPRIQEGLFLRFWATSMIDVSDGLATELHHITSMSKAGATLTANQIPLSDAAESVQSALTDGEDFELLFTVPCDKQNDFEVAWQKDMETEISLIGRITDKPDIIEISDEDGNITPLTQEGYQHF